MRGSVGNQAMQVFLKSGINKIGMSKHAAKIEAREGLDSKGVSATWHDMGKELGIHSYSTKDAYTNVWANVLQYAKEHYGVKDMEKLESQHVQGFLQSKIEQSVSRSTLSTYAAACEKLGVALEKYSEKFDRGNSYNFSSAIQTARDGAGKLETFQGSRAYNNPQSLVDSIKGEQNNLVARMQLESGCRIREASQIRAAQLGGYVNHPVRGDVGKISLGKGDTKGGKPRDVYVSRSTYDQVAQAVTDGGGKFKLTSQTGYYTALKEAAQTSGQPYTGSHGLRWNFAQDSMQRYMDAGQSPEQAMGNTSSDMGHERIDITGHYMK